MNQSIPATPTLAAPLALELLDLKAVHHPELERVTALAQSHGLTAKPLVYQQEFVCNVAPQSPSRDEWRATQYPVPANIKLSTLPIKSADSGRVSGSINALYTELTIGYQEVRQYPQLPETRQAIAAHRRDWEQANARARPVRFIGAVSSLVAMLLMLMGMHAITRKDSAQTIAWLPLLETIRGNLSAQYLVTIVLMIAFIAAGVLMLTLVISSRRVNEFQTEFTYRVRLSGFVPNRWRAIIADTNHRFEPYGVELIVATVYNPLTKQFDLAGGSAQTYLQLEHGSYTLGSFDFEPIDSAAPLERESLLPNQP